MVGGDKTCIGDKGVNLSGGQRARLALARFDFSLKFYSQSVDRVF